MCIPISDWFTAAYMTYYNFTVQPSKCNILPQRKIFKICSTKFILEILNALQIKIVFSF